MASFLVQHWLPDVSITFSTHQCPSWSFWLCKKTCYPFCYTEFSFENQKDGLQHWHIFCFHILVRCLSKGRKRFFWKKYQFFIKFSNSPNEKISWFFCKKPPTIKVKKTFLRSNISWYACYSKFGTFTNFEKFKFFFKKNSCVVEKSYYFSRIQEQICYKLVLKKIEIQNGTDIRIWTFWFGK